MKIKIENFNVLSAPAGVWDVFFPHIEAIEREVDPEAPLMPREKRKQMLISSQANPDANVYRFLMSAEEAPGAAVGYAGVAVETPHSPSYKTNKQIGNLNLYISRGHRRRGLGRKLLKRIIDELAAKEPAVTEFLAPVILDDGRRFLDRQGGTVSLETAENRLYLKDADWDMIEAWSSEGALKNPATSILTVPTIPQEDIEGYCAVYTEIINQQPFGDLSLRIEYTPEKIRFGESKTLEQGQTQVTMFSKESDGRVSGMTEIFHLRETGHKVTQHLTGVKADCRGRGLGKLLKARMLLHIRKEFPGVKYVVTGNADANAPMLAINNKLGFKKRLPVTLYRLKITP